MEKVLLKMVYVVQYCQKKVRCLLIVCGFFFIQKRDCWNTKTNYKFSCGCDFLYFCCTEFYKKKRTNNNNGTKIVCVVLAKMVYFVSTKKKNRNNKNGGRTEKKYLWVRNTCCSSTGYKITSVWVHSSISKRCNWCSKYI